MIIMRDSPYTRDVRGGGSSYGVYDGASVLRPDEFVDRRCQVRELREQPPVWWALQGAPRGINHREYLWLSKNGEPPLPLLVPAKGSGGSPFLLHTWCTCKYK